MSLSLLNSKDQVMPGMTAIAIDLAKDVFQVAGENARCEVTLSSA